MRRIWAWVAAEVVSLQVVLQIPQISKKLNTNIEMQLPLLKSLYMAAAGTHFHGSKTFTQCPRGSQVWGSQQSSRHMSMKIDCNR